MKSAVEESFWKFHEANPHVYELIDRYARQAVARGRTRLSISMIVERIRWEHDIETVNDKPFEINNTHRAYYARLWMHMNPEFKGFFKVRRLPSKGFATRLDHEKTKQGSTESG